MYKIILMLSTGICSQDLEYLPDLDGLCLCVFQRNKTKTKHSFRNMCNDARDGDICWFYDVIKRRFSESSSPIIRAICPCILVIDLAAVVYICTALHVSVTHSLIITV